MDTLESINSESVNWGKDHDMLFEFLYGTSCKMASFIREINIKYKDKYIVLCDLHGEGNYKYIDIVEDYNDLNFEGIIVIDYKDLIKFYEKGDLAIRYKAMNALGRSFMALEAACGGKVVTIDGVDIDLHDAYTYIAREIYSKKNNMSLE